MNETQARYILEKHWTLGRRVLAIIHIKCNRTLPDMYTGKELDM